MSKKAKQMRRVQHAQQLMDQEYYGFVKTRKGFVPSASEQVADRKKAREEADASNEDSRGHRPDTDYQRDWDDGPARHRTGERRTPSESPHREAR